MQCHGSPAQVRPESNEIILVGNHNVGKSVLFGWLTGKYVTVANYPGTTVELTRGVALYDGHRTVVDTPGINSLQPLSDDELVTRQVLLQNDSPQVVQVADAKNLRRALLITSQLAELEYPLVLVLNMMDEAKARHIEIDVAQLQAALGIPVVTATATKRQGLAELVNVLDAPVLSKPLVHFQEAIEHAVCQVEIKLQGVCAQPRAVAIAFLNGDTAIDEFVQVRVGANAYAALCRLRNESGQLAGAPLSSSMQRTRTDWVDETVRAVYSAADAHTHPAESFAGKLGRCPFFRARNRTNSIQI